MHEASISEASVMAEELTPDDWPPNELAARVAETLFAKDQATRHLEMHVEAVGPGSAVLSMRVRREMLNGHQTCHGGYIFTLADSAFAFACNSHNHNTVAAGCAIEYVMPVHLGDVLTASAEERALAGRTGTYDVVVRNQEGKTVALFRGRSYRIKGQVIFGSVDIPAGGSR